MDRLLRRFLSQFIRRGSITFTTASGAKFTCGDGTGVPVAARFLTPQAEIRILLNPELALGEAFMDGSFIAEQGSIADVLAILMDQPDALPQWAKPRWWMRYLIRHLRQLNLRKRAQENVAHHYDLDGRLYSLFLDADWQYSCAYFETPDVGLEEAQLAKKRHLAAKLLIERGHRVLDIGCGWGGLGLYLAETLGADVTGVTLSMEQWQASNARAAERRVGRTAQFLLQDYRDVQGRFDRIVSVGMFEHVGAKHYDEFFAKCRDLLKPDGVMLLHTIGKLGERSVTPDPFTDKWIFPGYHLPSLSEITESSEKVRLMASDVEMLRVHYAYTLLQWLDRAEKAREKIVAMYDERFFRMWEFYLAGGIVMFENGAACNYQVQYIRERTALPITRDYMAEAEARYRKLGAEPAPKKPRSAGRRKSLEPA